MHLYMAQFSSNKLLVNFSYITLLEYHIYIVLLLLIFDYKKGKKVSNM